MPPTGQAVYVTLSPLSARASGSLYALPSSTDTEKAKGALNWNGVKSTHTAYQNMLYISISEKKKVDI